MGVGALAGPNATGKGGVVSVRGRWQRRVPKTRDGQSVWILLLNSEWPEPWLGCWNDARRFLRNYSSALCWSIPVTPPNPPRKRKVGSR